MVTIKEGSYVPLYGAKGENKATKPVNVKSLQLDIYPIINAQYKALLEKYPEWQHSRVKGIFTQKSYLSYWQSDLDLSPLDAQASVTHISRFVVKKYCECEGKRPSTTDEWEYVIQAGAQSIDARKKKHYQGHTVRSMQTPKTYLQKVGNTSKNYRGAYNMHGLVREWVADFNSVPLSGDSRKGKQGDDALFYGGSALNVSDLTNYGTLTRYALRGSLRANYTVLNMGFRCVKNN